MSEQAKQSAARIAEAVKKFPEDKAEMAARIAETFANGIATGIELANAGKPKEAQ